MNGNVCKCTTFYTICTLLVLNLSQTFFFFFLLKRVVNFFTMFSTRLIWYLHKYSTQGSLLSISIIIYQLNTGIQFVNTNNSIPVVTVSGFFVTLVLLLFFGGGEGGEVVWCTRKRGEGKIAYNCKSIHPSKTLMWIRYQERERERERERKASGCLTVMAYGVKSTSVVAT